MQRNDPGRSTCSASRRSWCSRPSRSASSRISSGPRRRLRRHRAHNRMMADFCTGPPPRRRGLPAAGRSRSGRSTAVEEALELGCGALWVAHAPSAGGRPPTPTTTRCGQAAGGRRALHAAHRRRRNDHRQGVAPTTGDPAPPICTAAARTCALKDLPSVHHAAEMFLTAHGATTASSSGSRTCAAG